MSELFSWQVPSSERLIYEDGARQEYVLGWLNVDELQDHEHLNFVPFPKQFANERTQRAVEAAWEFGL